MPDATRASEEPAKLVAGSRLLEWAMRAYPRWWRAKRGAEFADLLAQLPRRGIGLPAEIVWCGWLTRFRGHPPFWRWLGYRVLNRRLPFQWRDWVWYDVQSQWYPVWRRTPNLFLFNSFVCVVAAVGGPLHFWVWLIGSGSAEIAGAVVDSFRRPTKAQMSTLERYALTWDGQPFPLSPLSKF